MRNVSKFVIAAVSATAAVFAVTAPANAGDAAKEKFVHEGFTYVYQVQATKDGKLISGTRYPGATAFKLKVKGDRVAGVSGGQQVAFNVAEAKGATQ